MQSVLIVDPFDSFRTELEKTLRKRYRVFSCCDGTTGLALLKEHRPDGLILNLSLLGMDGLTFLETAGDLRPDVILTLSSIYPSYALQRLVELGVGHSILIPCTVHTVVYRITDMLQKQGLIAPINAQEITAKNLQTLGAPYLEGYQMLRYGIPLYAQDRSQRLTKNLYPAIAALCDCDNWHQVESSIRYIIRSMWKHRDAEIWESFFPDCSRCPTNKSFIARLSDFLDV